MPSGLPAEHRKVPAPSLVPPSLVPHLWCLVPSLVPSIFPIFGIVREDDAGNGEGRPETSGEGGDETSERFDDGHQTPRR